MESLTYERFNCQDFNREIKQGFTNIKIETDIVLKALL